MQDERAMDTNGVKAKLRTVLCAVECGFKGK